MLRIVCSFWPEGELDGLPVMGLALGDYRYVKFEDGTVGFMGVRSIKLTKQDRF